MMIDKKRKLVEELIQQLDMAQGDDLGKMIEAKKKPKGVAVGAIEVIEPKDGEHPVDSEVNDAIKTIEGSSEGSPAMEQAECAMDGAESEEEKLSDDELAEMLKHYLA